MTTVRLDDLRNGRAQAFPAITTTLVARRPSEVIEVLRAVERATDAGAWAVGFLSYEAAAGLDPTLQVQQPRDDLPLAWFGLSAQPVPVPVVRPSGARAYTAGPWADAWTPEQYHAKVDAVRARIAAGDTYQCNLTTRLTAPVEGDLLGLYADLAPAQGAAYSAYLDLGDWVIASASPELFFQLDGDQLLLRPMKGTAPRGASRVADQRLAQELRASEKERAENIMIVDLLRNDAARIAAIGSVDVPVLWRVEQYETVHQLTSDVTATLRRGAGITDIFTALFPCGSITGAPKASTMTLIAELEEAPRGVYCGAIGVLAPPWVRRRARFSVAIRTAVVDRRSGQGTYGTGSGLTWPSQAAAEHAELATKAKVLARCLGAGLPTAALTH
jgi:aminodeoxychorismate synthase component I